jgi:hypothetical protein
MRCVIFSKPPLRENSKAPPPRFAAVSSLPAAAQGLSKGLPSIRLAPAAAPPRKKEQSAPVSVNTSMAPRNWK